MFDALIKGILNYIPFADFNALLDQAPVMLQADVWNFNRGFTKTYTNIRTAVEFLQKEQERDGSWFGRWGANIYHGQYFQDSWWLERT